MSEIVPVTTARQVRQFVNLPYSLYANHPHWVPPLRRDEYRRLSGRHNAFLQHARMDLWIASSGGRTTGRIAAIEDRRHNALHHEAVTWFGFLEAETAETAKALLAMVERRGVERASTAIRGPVNPSLNESAGLLIDSFDEDPYVLMPYNPPTYPPFVEAAGYRKVKDLLAWRIDASAPLPDRIARMADRAARRSGVSLRRLDSREFERDLGIVQRIYREAWEDNWGFVPPTDAEVRQLANEFRPVLDPNLVLFAELSGRAVGCAVAIPDMNQVLKRMRGRLLPFGILFFLRRRAIITQVRAILVGVTPDARRIGLYPLLIAELYKRAAASGYRWAELSWTLEDNDAIAAGIEAIGGRRHKTYRLYEKALR
jgi:GNAT superfamily N-acetyltransferase